MRTREFLLLLPVLVLPACGNPSVLGVAVNHDVVKVNDVSKEKKDASSCLDPSKVIAGEEYTCADGKKRKGTLTLAAGSGAKSPAACSKDGEEGCLTTKDFLSFPSSERARLLPGNIKAGVSIAGVTGTLTSAGPADCAADGEVACVSTAGFPAANAAGLASKVLSGQTVPCHSG